MKTTSFAHSRGKSNKPGEDSLTVDSPKQKLDSLSPPSTLVLCGQSLGAREPAQSWAGPRGCKTRRMGVTAAWLCQCILTEWFVPPCLQNSCLFFRKNSTTNSFHESLQTSAPARHLALKGLKRVKVSSPCVLEDLQDIAYLLLEYEEPILFHSLINIAFYQVFIE